MFRKAAILLALAVTILGAQARELTSTKTKTKPAAQKLTAALCAQLGDDFRMKDYDLGFGACNAVKFSFPGINSIYTNSSMLTGKEQKLENLRACSTLYKRRQDFCRNEPLDERAKQKCRSAIVAELSACKNEVEAVFFGCKAAELGIASICYDFGSRESNTRLLQSSTTCTETCVNGCITEYYEDYDYDAEQYCYYYTCLC